MVDVLVLGGGPAGASAARLLALRGLSVELVHRPSAAPHRLAETLPPSTRNIFHLLGIQKQIDAAGFYRTTGNTSWWESSSKRVEMYPNETGYQVPRADFDALLLGLAREAGVKAGGRGEGGGARITLDCTGRAGVLGGKMRVAQKGYRTIALCGIWRGVFPGVDETHTLVEAYSDGWVWSIPLARELRYVTVMTGRGRSYGAELAKTRAMKRGLAKCQLQGKTWGCDASLYTSRNFTGDGFLLVGDAGSFVDPISSFGVKKALTSAWLAAEAVVSGDFQKFEDCERQVYADHLRQAAALYAKGARRFPTPFWTERAVLHASQPDLRAALAKLRRQRSIALRRAPGARVGLEYCYGVKLQTLAAIAPDYRQVPELFDAYNKRASPVQLPAFLSALSLLIARGTLL